MMGYRNPDSGVGASVVVTVGSGQLFQLTGALGTRQYLLPAVHFRGTLQRHASTSDEYSDNSVDLAKQKTPNLVCRS